MAFPMSIYFSEIDEWGVCWPIEEVHYSFFLMSYWFSADHWKNVQHTWKRFLKSWSLIHWWQRRASVLLAEAHCSSWVIKFWQKLRMVLVWGIYMLEWTELSRELKLSFGRKVCLLLLRNMCPSQRSENKKKGGLLMPLPIPKVVCRIILLILL